MVSVPTNIVNSKTLTSLPVNVWRWAKMVVGCPEETLVLFLFFDTLRKRQCEP